MVVVMIFHHNYFLLFSYTDEENAKKIKELVENVRNRFPREGISIFAVPACEIWVKLGNWNLKVNSLEFIFEIL